MATVATDESASEETLKVPSPHAPCTQCGAPLEKDDKFCSSCGSAQATTTAPTAAPVDQQRFHCQNCGAEVTVERSARSFTCPFCDSNYVTEVVAGENRQSPEFVIGFRIPPEQAAQSFHEWIGAGGWFRPSDLPFSQVVEKLRGVYLPFWSFSMLAVSEWSANIGEHWTRTETYTTTENGQSVTRTREVQETEWWPLQGRHQNYYSGYLVSGSRGLAQRETDRLQPFQLESLKRYDPAYLAGWLSEDYSIEREAAMEICQKEFQRREQSSVSQFMPGDTASGVNVQTEFSEANSDLILLPVYMLSYRHGEKLYRFLVNGQTGKVIGQKPISTLRVAIAVGLGLIAAAALWWFAHR